MYLERDIEEILKYPSGNFDYPDSGWEEHLNYLYSSRERIGELERTNEVISKSKLSMGRFYENRFYIFNYQYKNDNKLRKFIDIRPLVFVIDEFYEKDNREIVKGINFNFLPKKARMIFLQLYFKLFFSKHETDVNNFERDELILYPYSRKERVFFLKEIERLYP
jgi:ABC-type ATPase with predicted acetyltransferase domain